ncbi:MAG: RNA polymerase sigma factor region1.1 domain-containing protein, partial [Betaproteobacteria bacterium]
MAKPKRKSKLSKVTKAKKKVIKNKVLKKKLAPKARPAAKKVKAAKKPLKKLIAKKPVAHTKVPPAKGAPKVDAKKGKAALKTTAKQALELLEANVAAAKSKLKGRPGRKGKKDAWLIPPELPKEDAETRRTRLKNLIKLGKDRGFLTYSEINDHLPDDLVDAEQIEAIISTFGDMGIQ